MQEPAEPAITETTAIKPATREEEGRPGQITTPSTDYGLLLQDIFPANDEHEASAIIQLQDTQADLFTEGSDVFGLATLEQILADRVILNTDTGQITLVLLAGTATPGEEWPDNPFGSIADISNKLKSGEISVSDLLANAAAHRTDGDAPGNSSARATLVKKRILPPPGGYQGVLARIRKENIENPSDLTWAFVTYEPEVRQDTVTGVRLTGHEEMDFLNSHGLEYGDVITRVNGSKIDSQAAAIAAMNMISAEEKLELVVESGSQTKTITIDKKRPNTADSP